MKPNLKDRLSKCENLSLLARLAGVNVRTLRRLRAGDTKSAHPFTEDAIVRAFKSLQTLEKP